ncbi:MAG TPA: thioesterase family protein [Polyangiaceae bacterium]
MIHAFFRPAEGNATTGGHGAFDATEHTRGPWAVDHQHGGPPSALAGRALEAVAGALGVPTPLRFTVELLRPIPIGRLLVSAEASPEGRGVRRVHGRIVVDGVEVLRILGLFASTRSVDVDVVPDTPVPTPPESGAEVAFPFFRWPVGYHTAMELRYARGKVGDASVFAWMRMRMPLVEGENTSPAQRVLVAADSGNGVTAALDWNRYNFANPDLTVALGRLPEGEWIGLDAEMRTERSGVGLAATTLWDRHGVLGRGAQTLLVRPAR